MWPKCLLEKFLLDFITLHLAEAIFWHLGFPRVFCSLFKKKKKILFQFHYICASIYINKIICICCAKLFAMGWVCLNKTVLYVMNNAMCQHMKLICLRQTVWCLHFCTLMITWKLSIGSAYILSAASFYSLLTHLNLTQFSTLRVKPIISMIPP